MVTLPVYGEKLVSDALREHPSVVALQARVVGTTPQDTRQPWIRVVQIDDTSATPPDHLHRFLFQADVYAGENGSGYQEGQPGANLLERTVRAVVAEMDEEGYQADEGVVTGAAVTACSRVPDQDFTPARERFIMTLTIWAHL